METRPYPHKEATRRLVPVIAIGALGVLIGVAVILFLKPNGLFVGLALIVVSSILEGALLVAVVLNPRCPECQSKLSGRAGAGTRLCERCGIEWALNER